MAEYLGETIVKAEDTEEFKNFTPSDWALYFINAYGQIDGDHHKLWVLDQVVRILKGTKIIITIAKWDDGYEEYRVVTDEPSEEYKNWVIERKDGEDGPETYGYDEGIAP